MMQERVVRGSRVRVLVSAFAVVLSSSCSSGNSGGGSALQTGVFLFADGSGPLASDAARLYYKTNTGFAGQPFAGGTAVTYGGPHGNVYGLAVDPSGVYYTDFDDGTVNAAPITGGASAAIAIGQDRPQEIIAAGGRVFWVNHPLQGPSVLMSVAASGGATVVVDTVDGIEAIASDGTSIFYFASSVNQIKAVAVTGGTPARLVGLSDRPTTLLAQDGTLYWSSFDSKRISSAAIATGKVTEILRGLPARPSGLAVRDGVLYWVADVPGTENDRTTVNRMPISGTTPEVLATGRPSNGLGGVIAGPTYVYWSEQATDVYALAR